MAVHDVRSSVDAPYDPIPYRLMSAAFPTAAASRLLSIHAVAVNSRRARLRYDARRGVRSFVPVIADEPKTIYLGRGE